MPGAALIHQLLLGLDLGLEFLDALLGELDLQVLELDLLGQGVVLPVVAHLGLLAFVLLDLGLGVLDQVLLVAHLTLQVGQLAFQLVQAGLQTSHLILQVLDLQGQFTPLDADAVHLGIDGLQAVQRGQLVRHRGLDPGGLLGRCGLGTVLTAGRLLLGRGLHVAFRHVVQCQE